MLLEISLKYLDQEKFHWNMLHQDISIDLKFSLMEPKVSKWDIWDLHLCQRAADLLSLTYTSASYSSATGWNDKDDPMVVVGWLGG